MNEGNLLSTIHNAMMHGGYKIMVILAVTLMVMRLTHLGSNRFFQAMTPKKKRGNDEYKKRLDTLSGIFRQVINITLGLTAMAMILNELGIKIGPIIAAAGIIGVAVGFGAQSLVKDVISGFFILLEDQIRVGDVVEIAGKAGVVEQINLKMTILRDLAGNVHYIPNGAIEVVTNMTKGYSRYVFDIGVAYRENVDEVMAVMMAVDEALRADPEFGPDILEPLEMLGLDRFGDSALIIKARTTTKPIKQWRVAREFNRRLKIAFDKKGIEIPFPHLTLYMGQDKAGGAPPLRISHDSEEGPRP